MSDYTPDLVSLDEICRRLSISISTARRRATAHNWAKYEIGNGNTIRYDWNEVRQIVKTVVRVEK